MWTKGQCCDINDFTSPEACKTLPTVEYTAFCARGSSITNKFLREFLIPASEDYCPSQANYKQVLDSSYTGDNYLVQEHPFKMEVPTVDAAKWHCKYHLTSTEAIATAAVDDRGYTYIEAE